MKKIILALSFCYLCNISLLAQINHISNGQSMLSVRTTINQAIDSINKLDTALSKAFGSNIYKVTITLDSTKLAALFIPSSTDTVRIRAVDSIAGVCISPFAYSISYNVVRPYVTSSSSSNINAYFSFSNKKSATSPAGIQAITYIYRSAAYGVTVFSFNNPSYGTQGKSLWLLIYMGTSPNYLISGAFNSNLTIYYKKI